MSNPVPAIANSLNNPRLDEPADRDRRRVIADEASTTPPPVNSPVADVSKGWRVRHHRFLHVVAQSVGGTSFVLRLWVKSDFANTWALCAWFGTGGAITVTTATEGGVVQPPPLEIDGIDEVFFEISTNTGAAASVWAAGQSA